MSIFFLRSCAICLLKKGGYCDILLLLWSNVFFGRRVQTQSVLSRPAKRGGEDFGFIQRALAARLQAASADHL